MPNTKSDVKDKISLRLEQYDLEMLDKVSKMKGTMFYGKNRTVLVIGAIRNADLPFIIEKEDKI